MLTSSHGLDRISGSIHLLRFVVPFAAAWGTLLFQRWQKRRKEEAAQGWPSIECPVISVKVEPVKKTTRFVATVTYSYFVGEYRTGQYVHEFAREAEADEFARQMKDKRVLIRYRQDNPDVSVLEESVVRQMVLLTSPAR